MFSVVTEALPCGTAVWGFHTLGFPFWSHSPELHLFAVSRLRRILSSSSQKQSHFSLEGNIFINQDSVKPPYFLLSFFHPGIVCQDVLLRGRGVDSSPARYESFCPKNPTLQPKLLALLGSLCTVCWERCHPSFEIEVADRKGLSVVSLAYI